MNIIISFAGLKSSPGPTPYPLRRIAGSTILGHILVHLLDLPLTKLILILDSGQEQVQKWVERNVPDLALQILLVQNANTPLAVLKPNKAVFDAGPLLFISGNYIAEVNYLDLISSDADALCLLQPEQNAVPAEELRLDEAGFIEAGGKNTSRWAGSFWIQHGTDLIKAFEAVEGRGALTIGQLLYILAAQDLKIATAQAEYCLDTRSIDTMLYANARLLSLDLGSQDAIERSYAEDFTVLPPVFLHETAVIENSVIGPFVNLEAHASICNSIVRNSLIGTGTKITDAILHDSLIGDNTVITGHSSTLIADNGAILELDDRMN